MNTVPTILGISQFAAYARIMDSEIGDRIRSRMKASAPELSQKAIAENIEMTPDAFSRALSGKRAFTAVELVKIAEILGTSVHWFVTGEPDPLAVTVAGRHTFDHQSRTHQQIDWASADSVLSNISLAYLQVDWQEVRPREVADRSPLAIRRLLENVGGAEFIRRLSSLITQVLGIDFIRVQGVATGFALQVGDRQAIIVGETGSWFHENWSIAHELAHILAGDLATVGESACDDPQAERAANSFAAEFLLPAVRLKALDWKSISPVEVARLIWESGVSTQALATRLASLRVTVPAHIASLLELKTQALLRRHGSLAGERDAITERMNEAASRRFPDDLLAAHREAIEDGRLAPDTLAWMLGVDVAGLEEQLSPLPAEHLDVDWLARELGLDSAES